MAITTREFWRPELRRLLFGLWSPCQMILPNQSGENGMSWNGHCNKKGGQGSPSFLGYDNQAHFRRGKTLKLLSMPISFQVWRFLPLFIFTKHPSGLGWRPPTTQVLTSDAGAHYSWTGHRSMSENYPNLKSDSHQIKDMALLAIAGYFEEWEGVYLNCNMQSPAPCIGENEHERSCLSTSSIQIDIWGCAPDRYFSDNVELMEQFLFSPNQ